MYYNDPKFFDGDDFSHRVFLAREYILALTFSSVLLSNEAAKACKNGKVCAKIYRLLETVAGLGFASQRNAFTQPFSFLNLLHVLFAPPNKFFTDDSFVIWLKINLEKILFYVVF